MSESERRAPIDVLIVNLYPFEDKVAKGVPFDEAIEYFQKRGGKLVKSGLLRSWGRGLCTLTSWIRSTAGERTEERFMPIRWERRCTRRMGASRGA